MMPSRKTLADLGIAVAAVGLATFLRWLADPWLEDQLPLIAYLLVVLVVARALPLGPTMVTIVLGAVVGGYLFVPPRGSWLPQGDSAVLAINEYARYFIVCLAMAAICEAMRRAERAAEERERILAATTDAALDCIITIDADDRIVEFNRSAERTFGHSRAAVIGRNVRELLLTPEARGRHAAGLARRIESGELDILGQRLEGRAMRADGSDFPMEVAVTRLELEGRPLFTAFVRDLSERHAAAEALAQSEARFRDLVGQVADYAIFTMDLDGRATSWNEGVRNVLGYEEHEFLGREVAPMIFRAQDIAAGIPDRELEVAARTGTSSNDRWMRRKDGSSFFAAGVTIPHRDSSGAMLGYAKIMRDQTTRQEMETRLRESAEEIAQAMRNQSRFLAMLSHELRNPMAALRNAAEILRIAGPGGSVPAVEMVGRQVEHMGRLIDDLLDASRIRSGRVHLHRARMDVVAAIEHAIEVERPGCDANGQRLAFDRPAEALWIDGDFTRIVQVVGNLLHNACKFTPRGGSVTVAARRAGEVAEVTVADTGVGIAADHLSHIFEMFLQVDAHRVRSHGGLGIGLSVVKSLVEMHGGSIEARSEGADRGAQFVVRLPLAAAAAKPAPRKGEGASIGPQRILVLDDNRDAAESLELVLKLYGHDARSVNDGPAALAEVASWRPAVALLDLGLPEMDGYEVARRIRAGPWGLDIVLVAVTGWGQEEDRRRTREAGFDAHLTKPVEYPHLAEVLAGLLQRERPTGT